jgi:hypothetical protein
MNKDMREFYIFKLKAHFMIKWGIEDGLAQGLAFIAVDFPEKHIIKILEN